MEKLEPAAIHLLTLPELLLKHLFGLNCIKETFLAISLCYVSLVHLLKVQQDSNYSSV